MELTDGKFKSVCIDYAITRTTTEPHSPWQNKAELQIKEVKKNVRSLMKYKSIPSVLWDYCASYYALIKRNTATMCPDGDHRCPIEIVTGHTPDISELVDYGLYDPCYFYEPVDFPMDRKILGRWLGPAHSVGQALCYWILTSQGIVIARSTVTTIDDTVTRSDQFEKDIKMFDKEYPDTKQ